MAQIEPMDIDSEFDNKENSLHHNNVLSRTPCTEKGYEELDVSEMNMRLRYSITPASSPMSKSFTANSLENRTFDSEDCINNVVINENCNLTRSLNSTITRNNSAKLPKSLPLQVLSSESITDNRNTSVLRTLDKASEDQDNNVTITLSGQKSLDDNMSLPSTSSTPEANTPTKEIPKLDGGSPIMRGLKSVLNMFRSSQSPIPPADVNCILKQEIFSPKESILIEDRSKSHVGMASTPISNKQREVSSSQRSSPLKESIVFNDDLERELQWKDETTILFKEEKIPIHKLLLPQSLCSISKKGEVTSVSTCLEKKNLNNTVEHMDISYTDSFSEGMVGRSIELDNKTNTIYDQFMIESDGEFVDCETTINNDDMSDSEMFKNLTSSITSQNITLKQSHNEREKEYYMQINCDNKTSTYNKDDCGSQNLAESVTKSHDVISNIVGVLEAEYQNKIVSTGENSRGDKSRQCHETELINNNNPNNNISIDIIVDEHLAKEQNTKLEETLANSKNPSDIPLPDEDDIENVLNFHSATVNVARVDQQMGMGIDYNETCMIEKKCTQSENEEKKQLGFNCIYKNETTKINNQEIVVINENHDELINAQLGIDKKDNLQIINSNDNFTFKIDNAPLEETTRVTLVDEDLNVETNSKMIMDSLETNNEKHIETVTNKNKTNCDVNINQSEHNTLWAQNSNKSACTENINEIAEDKESNLLNMEILIQEKESRCTLEKNNLEKLENINCTNYLGADNKISPFNDDVKDLSLTKKFYVHESEVSNKPNFESNTVCILATKDNMDTITVPKSPPNTLAFMQQNKNFEINMDNIQEGQESQDVETISQSTSSFKLHNALNALEKDTISGDVKIICNEIKNIESIALDKDMSFINSTFKIENIVAEEGEKTVLKGVIQTSQDENCIGTLLKNESSKHISQTNEKCDKSLDQNDTCENIEVEEKPDKYDHVDNKEKTVENNNLNNSHTTFNMSIGQEDEIENKVIEEYPNKCEHETYSENIRVLESASIDNTFTVNNTKEIEEYALNVHSIAVCTSVLDEDNLLCKKEEIAEIKNEQVKNACEQQIASVNVSQRNESNTGNSVVVKEAKNSDLYPETLLVSTSKIDTGTTSNVASTLICNMSIDGNADECENLLNIRCQKIGMLDSNNRNYVVVNANEELTLNQQNITISESNSEDLYISKVISDATSKMNLGKDNTSENKEYEYEFQANETEECAINKKNVTIINSELNDCAISNETYIADCDKENSNSIVQQTGQTYGESESNNEPVFLSERKVSPSKNVPIENNAIDQRISSDDTSKSLFMEDEIKNNKAKQEESSMEKTLRTLTLLSVNSNEKVEIENFDEKLRDSIELGDCSMLKMESRKSPPLSPAISSKGYNFNFDEIDDPFATKTRIRASPPPEDCPGSNETEISKRKCEINKKDFQRRKSMPVKRQPPSFKNKINSTFSEAVDYKEIKQYTKATEKMENDIAKSACDIAQESVNPHSTTLEKNSVQTEETHKYIEGLTNSENFETSSHEAEKTSNLSSSTIFSVDKCKAKNVFNLPEMSSGMDFSPFATKYKVCRTPSPVLGESTSTFKIPANMNEHGPHSVNPDADIMSDVAELHVGSKTDYDSSIASSSSKGTEDTTVREVNTEDEDTVEGPFFEADDLNGDEKMSEFVGDSEDMMNFNDIPPQIEDNVDNGEMFIDAEAFEFLLNQNKSNMVVDSGKESLFLKFDPLFAKRMSSNGVLAALNKVQNRQSTPKSISKDPTIDVTCDKISTETLNANATAEVNSTFDNNFEDPNTTVSKPMMVVNPAVKSIISPRNKSIVTPPRANRRSLTFTSPAIAVIDRLLSLSGNNSIIDTYSDAPTRQVQREQNETDLALTQLRELLAEKEIHVRNLRLESKELKERLFTLETQVKSLESEGEHRLRKVNELNERLVEKTNLNRSMAAVVEEYERTIASLIAETEQDKKRHAEERMRLVNERDEQTAHLASMEISFNDLHSKYEKSKQIILACKSNEDTHRRSIKEFEESLLKMQNNYESLKQHATSKLNQANQELEKLNRAHEAEVVKLNAMIKRKDLHITSLEETLAQKTKANEELTAICDELINKVG